jgi:hypoxanthine phosphoribosyltransferase
MKRTDLDVLIDEETLQKRITELAREISNEYADKDLALIAILKGSYMFLADLSRALTVECTVDFLGVSSYGHRSSSTGVVQITSDLTAPIEGRDVLIVEDIIDTGLTMRYLLENLATRKPRSIKVCSLLHKPSRSKVEVPVDYVGFVIEDHFVIGYGLDYHDRFRNVPFIGHKTH